MFTFKLPNAGYSPDLQGKHKQRPGRPWSAGFFTLYTIRGNTTTTIYTDQIAEGLASLFRSP